MIILEKKRILSGMRPTGNLHIGHLVGALQNWVKLQDEYDCFYMVADWHAISTAFEDKLNLKRLTVELVAEWLACGLTPEKSTLFVQSSVKQHSELHLLLSMITPLSWVERNPTFKEMLAELKNKDISTYGFLGYPVLQAADIIIYLGEYVPVGVDQLPHIELCRELVRRFHFLYKEIFKEPQALLTDTPKLPGLDNRKMSKSYENCIYLSDDEMTLRYRINSMITDPARIRKTDKGHPKVCSVYAYHSVFNKDISSQICKDCIEAKIGCVDCKKKLFDTLNNIVSPIRNKRNELLNNESELIDIIRTGNKKAATTAEETMIKVREAMNIGLF